ncbi:ABC transporter ATP-binding protein [Aquisalibacillus elongatus]|uniref:Phosphate ABC transporter ATP-binding protein (PhoT family) n=1 Tax=Aquisalibacillus elongatus TaxID=485577 RepID=A0A3N5BK46_9BACI|nr:phosphate ABC transporter ATP-binding protein [Aquisalibacillus elongatus]RPF55630.1 phosphate ABC transporter ATP-binding protein (PhoT family) [Aquisalibacillus elongatus]
MSQTIFELKSVYKIVLQDISLKINHNERVMIFGPSGSGKSTLLHLFNRLEDPEQGEIMFRGEPIETYRIPELRKNIGLVLQQPYLFPDTVLDNLKYGPNLFEDWKEEEVQTLLNYVNLPIDYLDKDVDDLSGGEKQRVSLARTLANKPEILLLDEPTSALDDQNIESIEQDLLNLIQSKQLTVVMVTHNLEQAKRLGNKGVYLEGGRIVEQGSLPDMIDHPKTEALKRFTTNY